MTEVYSGKILAPMGKRGLSPVEGGGSFKGALDSFTANLSGAWSVARRLLTSYAGSLINVRRSSDNTAQDIGYAAGGLLDTASLAAFVGANNGYIVKIYDQSGAGKDAIQSTSGSQPTIVNSGTLNTLSGKPCAIFDGVIDTLAVSIDTASVLAYSTILASVGATWNNYGSPLECQVDFTADRLGVFNNGSTQWYTSPTIAACRKNGIPLSGPAFDMTTINAAMVLGVDTAIAATGSAIQMGALGVIYYLNYKSVELAAWSTTANRTAFEANQKTFVGA